MGQELYKLVLLQAGAEAAVAIFLDGGRWLACKVIVKMTPEKLGKLYVKLVSESVGR